MNTRLAAALAAAIISAAAVSAPAARAAGTPCPVISGRLGLHWPYHTAAGQVWPENSAAAAAAAHAAGAAKIELDLWFSRDGVPIAIHDPWLNRVTRHTGAVAGYTAAQLTAMALKVEGVYGNNWMSSQHLATVQQLLDVARRAGLAVSLEVKPAAVTAGQAAAVSARVGWAGMWGRVDARSYMPAVLAALRAADRRWAGHTTLIAAAAVPDPAPDSQESVDVVDHPLTAGQVAELHTAGLGVDVYTPETVAQYAAVPAGADQVTTDNVAGLAAWQAGVCR